MCIRDRYYPAKDLIFYQADIHGNLLIRQRLQVIQALLERKEVTIITSVGGCMDFLLPLDVFEKHCIHLRNDSELDLDKIRKELVRLGYCLLYTSNRKQKIGKLILPIARIIISA